VSSHPNDSSVRRRRIRYFGESLIPLTDEFPNAVKLILRTKLRQGDLVQGIAGTGFVVSMESKIFGSALRHLYLVTAAHVVSGAHEVDARLRLLDGTTEDALITNWVRLGL